MGSEMCIRDRVMAVVVAIERHGYLDHILTYPEWEEEQKRAIAAEDAFCAQREDMRTKEVNAALISSGYSFIQLPVTDLDLVNCLNLIGNTSQLEELQKYAKSVNRRSLESIIASLKQPIIIQTLMTRPNLPLVRGSYIMSYLLDRISSSQFFGRTLSDAEKASYTIGIYNFCHGKRVTGFRGYSYIEWKRDGTVSEKLLRDAPLNCVFVNPRTNLQNLNFDTYFSWLNHAEAQE